MSNVGVSIPSASAPSPPFTFRTFGDAISPTWLNGPVGQKFRYSMSVMYDALETAGALAIVSGLPPLAPADALPWIGLDRQIFQGFGESSTSYVNRLLQWLDLWRHAGSSTGLLLAMLGYVGPKQPEVLTVQSDGTSTYSVWDSYSAGQGPFPPGQTNPTPPLHYVTATHNWRWDSLSQPFYDPWMYWRKWIIIFSTGTQAPWAAPTLTWDSFDWDTGGLCWDWSGQAAQATALTNLAKQWKSAGAWVPWVIVSYDATMFDSSSTFGSVKLPDGHWGYWGKIVADATYGTKYVAARPASSTCSFITGTNDGGGVLGVG